MTTTTMQMRRIREILGRWNKTNVRGVERKLKILTPGIKSTSASGLTFLPIGKILL